MRKMITNHGLMGLLGCIGLILSCGSHKPIEVLKLGEPASLEVAMHSLTINLVNAVQEKRSGKLFSSGQVNLIIDPFFDANTRNIPKISENIEKMIADTVQGKFDKIMVKQLSYKNLKTADYVISGAIGRFSYRHDESQEEQKYFRAFGSIRDLKLGKTIHSADEWISDKDLDMTPISSDKDNPIYDIMPAENQESAVQNVQQELAMASETPAGYADQLEYKALLADAAAAYDRNDYPKALELYQTASKTKEGHDIKTYGGLYIAHLRLGNALEAENAFNKLVALSIEKYNRLTVKLMFKVNSIQFLDDPFLNKQYDIWIRSIGAYLNDSPYCLNIVGHCSKSGETDYNTWLSYCRATQIGNMIKPHLKKAISRSVSTGEGFNKCLIGTGADNETDAIDRRVEFILVDCAEIEKIELDMREKVKRVKGRYRFCPQ